jgi:pectate lyase
LLLLALPASARTLEVGPGKQFAQPSQAAAVAQDGDRVVIAPGQYFDCAVWRQNNLTVEGMSTQNAVITDKTCQGKALFVIPGSNVTVRNLTLTRARVPDGNGAGIRVEGRNLLVEQVRFVDNQNGILAAGRDHRA